MLFSYKYSFWVIFLSNGACSIKNALAHAIFLFMIRKRRGKTWLSQHFIVPGVYLVDGIFVSGVHTYFAAP